MSFFRSHPLKIQKDRGSRSIWTKIWMAQLFLAMGLISCRTPHVWDPINLSEHGWQVRQGQAIWQPERGRQEIAGELFYAAHRDGRTLVQFTKTPLNIITAHSDGGHWRIQFGPNHRQYSGIGQPPDHFAWFQLRSVFTDFTAGPVWTLTAQAPDEWRLAHQNTGETLHVFIAP